MEGGRTEGREGGRGEGGRKGGGRGGGKGGWGRKDRRNHKSIPHMSAWYWSQSSSLISANPHLLPARKLELCSPERLDRCSPVTVLCAQGHDGLANVHTSYSALRFAKSTPHTCLEPETQEVTNDTKEWMALHYKTTKKEKHTHTP